MDHPNFTTMNTIKQTTTKTTKQTTKVCTVPVCVV